MPDIKVRGVSKYFGSVKALHGVDLDLLDREYTVLLGPSGCGKTTLLKIIAGIVEPASGSVSIGRAEVVGVPPEDRGIGFVFQNYALFPHMSALNNAAYGLVARGTAPDKARRVAQEMLELVHLGQRGEALPRELSGGMQQRLAMARALATGSKTMLLDEPMNALDAHIRLELRMELRRMVKKLGLTAVHVTHDQEEAMALADRIVIMRKGQVLQVGTPHEVYRRPASPFVAGFLGEANFLRAHFENGKAELLGKRVGARLNGDYVAVIRPERLQLGGKGAKVKIVEGRMFGPYYKYDVDYEGMRLGVRTRVEKAGATRLAFDPRDVLFFKEPEEGLEKSLLTE